MKTMLFAILVLMSGECRCDYVEDCVEVSYVLHEASVGIEGKEDGHRFWRIVEDEYGNILSRTQISVAIPFRVGLPQEVIPFRLIDLPVKYKPSSNYPDYNILVITWIGSELRRLSDIIQELPPMCERARESDSNPLR